MDAVDADADAVLGASGSVADVILTVGVGVSTTTGVTGAGASTGFGVGGAGGGVIFGVTIAYFWRKVFSVECTMGMSTSAKADSCLSVLRRR